MAMPETGQRERHILSQTGKVPSDFMNYRLQHFLMQAQDRDQLVRPARIQN
jgi:hypothetical protein